MYRLKSKLYPEIKDVRFVGKKGFRDARNNRNWVLIMEHSRSSEYGTSVDPCYLVLIAIFVVRKSKN